MFDACHDENDEGKDKLGRTWIVGAWLDRLIASFHGPLILYVPAGLWFSYKHILHRRICTRYCARAIDREKRGREKERERERERDFALMDNGEKKNRGGRGDDK